MPRPILPIAKRTGRFSCQILVQEPFMPFYLLRLTTAQPDHCDVQFEADSDREAVRDALSHVGFITDTFREAIDQVCVYTLTIGRYDPTTGLFGTYLHIKLYDSDDLDSSIAPAPAEPARVLVAEAVTDSPCDEPIILSVAPVRHPSGGYVYPAPDRDPALAAAGRRNCLGVLP